MKKSIKSFMVLVAGALLASCSEVVDNGTTLSFVVPGSARAAFSDKYKVKLEITSDDGLSNYEVIGTSGDVIEVEVDSNKFYDVHAVMYKSGKNPEYYEGSNNPAVLEKYYSGKSSVLARRGFNNQVKLNMEIMPEIDLVYAFEGLDQLITSKENGYYTVTFSEQTGNYTVNCSKDVIIKGSPDVFDASIKSATGFVYVVKGIDLKEGQTLSFWDLTIDATFLDEEANTIFNSDDFAILKLTNVTVKNLDNSKYVLYADKSFPEFNNVKINRVLPKNCYDICFGESPDISNLTIDNIFNGKLLMGNNATITLGYNFSTKSRIYIDHTLPEANDSCTLINLGAIGSLTQDQIDCFKITLLNCYYQTGTNKPGVLLSDGTLQNQ